MGDNRLPVSVSEPQIGPYKDGLLIGLVPDRSHPIHLLSRVRLPRGGGQGLEVPGPKVSATQIERADSEQSRCICARTMSASAAWRRSIYPDLSRFNFGLITRS